MYKTENISAYPNIEGHFMRILFVNAMNAANQYCKTEHKSEGYKLTTLWNRLNQDAPVGAWSDYITSKKGKLDRISLLILIYYKNTGGDTILMKEEIVLFSKIIKDFKF